ncbi:MAG: potassium transporter TrkA, partial [Chloroflexi bacterium]|nr:potassium transporter TrkA [Chloroflexota bacterium]
MRKFTLRERLQYRFDNVMARGMIAVIGWLLLSIVIVIVLVSLVAVITSSTTANDTGETQGFAETLWNSLMHTIDGGTLADDDTADPLAVGLMLVVTAFGIFIFSALIGILTSAIDAKLTDLRKGRSVVIERGHTVILGWSPQVFSIISELVIANANQPDACIAILAPVDKVEMEDALRTRVGPTGRTRVVCRTGSPIELTDLAIVNPDDARSIIILSGEATDPDAHVIKSMLALTNDPRRMSHEYHIVAEIRDYANLEVAQLVGRDRASLLPVSELISRIAVQTCRQSGLSVVYIELLDFEGDEIYFQEEPALLGRTFGDVLLLYETSTVMGLRLRDGQVVLKPAMDYVLHAGDQVIAISEDDDTVALSGYGVPVIEQSMR